MESPAHVRTPDCNRMILRGTYVFPYGSPGSRIWLRGGGGGGAVRFRPDPKAGGGGGGGVLSVLGPIRKAGGGGGGAGDCLPYDDLYLGLCTHA